MNERKLYKLIKLGNDNYHVWKWQFKNVLTALQLEHTLSPMYSVTPAEDCQAMALLGSSLSEDNIMKIEHCKTFLEAWNAIGKYQSKKIEDRQFRKEAKSILYARLNSSKIKSAQEVIQWLSEITGIVALLNNLNEYITDASLTKIILDALPNSFDNSLMDWWRSSDEDVYALIFEVMAEANKQIREEQEEASQKLRTCSSERPRRKSRTN